MAKDAKKVLSRRPKDLQKAKNECKHQYSLKKVEIFDDWDQVASILLGQIKELITV